MRPLVSCVLVCWLLCGLFCRKEETLQRRCPLMRGKRRMKEILLNGEHEPDRKATRVHSSWRAFCLFAFSENEAFLCFLERTMRLHWNQLNVE